MPHLADLHRAVEAALAAGRLGTPVFVRYLLLVPGGEEAIPPRLAQMAENVGGWIGQPLVRVYAPAPPQAGAASLTLQYGAGATAVVSVGPGDSAADVMVLGNRGAVYHELSGCTTYEVPPPHPGPQLLAIIERALRSTRPESVS